MKVQVVRAKAQKDRLYVNIPVPLAAAIGIEPGEQVEWELLDRGELHLIRCQVPKTRAKRRAKRDVQ
jgi:hypothetical protein